MRKLNFIGIIPARYASTRFPGKPLAILGGKPVIEHVWAQVSSVLEHVVVATDDERISDAVSHFGGKAIMTDSHHHSGTDRCYEAYIKNGGAEDVIINIQGDEPFVSPEQIREIMKCFDDDSTDIATLAKPLNPDEGNSRLLSPNVVKVVMDTRHNAMYFSRSVIPFIRNAEVEQWPLHHQYYTHLGMYAYRAKVLEQITHLPQSPLELAESLEQLRWLENGMRIKVGISTHETIGIDTPEDLIKAEEYLRSLKNM